MTKPNDGYRDRGPDRRWRPTRLRDALITPARRHWNRRAVDDRRYCTVDRHGPRLFVLVLALLLLTILDGLLTLLLIDTHEDEANPVMAHLLERGSAWFVLGKYALTAAGAFCLVLWKNHRMFGSPVRVKHLIGAVVGLYVLLTAFQVWALVDPHAPARVASLLSWPPLGRSGVPRR